MVALIESLGSSRLPVHTAPRPAALPQAARIAAVTDENYRTKTFVLDAALPAQPGQFVMAWLPRFDEKPFSLVAADPVTLMVTAVGPFSRLLHEQHVGDRLWLRGPFGRGFAVAQSYRLALVGGGYGVAPLLWLARRQLDTGAEVTAIVGARTAADLLYLERFAGLGEAGGAARLHLIAATEDGSRGQQGRATDALAPLLAAGQLDLVCGCGPHAMLEAVAALSAGRVPCQLSWEAYMRCGIGICGACEHDGQVLCLDGPVLTQP